MSFQHYEKVVGDTFFEANLKAENRFGKGNFEIIATKRVKHLIYLGFGHKEVVELTICVHSLPRPERKNTAAPSRPLPSEELSLPRTVFSTIPEAEKTSLPPVPTFKSATPARQTIDENPRPAAVKTSSVNTKPIKEPAPIVDRTAINNYVRNQKPTHHSHSTREVHGLRSNQEGDQEPRPQKIGQENGLQEDQIQDILSHLYAVKTERQKIDRIAGKIGKSNTSSKTTETLTEPTSAQMVSAPEVEKMTKMFEMVESKMGTILAALQKMNIDTGKVLERETPDLPKGLFEVKKELLAMETPAEVADDLVSNLRIQLPSSALTAPTEAFRATTSWLERKLKFSSEINLRETTGPNIVVLIGPTGVGKTTTIAKLAAAYGLNAKFRNSVALFTMDTFRIGATDQLQHYAQIIDVDMEVLYRPEDVDSALSRHQDKSLIIVDTAGRCQKDTQELTELRSFIDRLPAASRYLVLSATSKYVDMLDTIKCFGRVGFEHIIFTKVDETNTIGPLLAVLFKTGKSLAYITNGQKVPDDFRPAGFDFFTNRLFAD